MVLVEGSGAGGVDNGPCGGIWCWWEDKWCLWEAFQFVHGWGLVDIQCFLA